MISLRYAKMKFTISFKFLRYKIMFSCIFNLTFSYFKNLMNFNMRNLKYKNNLNFDYVIS